MECLKMIKVWNKEQFHIVPCGKCAYCLTNKRSSWQFRIYHEMRNQMHPGYFLTMTYDEKHVKRVSYVDPDTGADVTRLSLRFRDVQLFLKRIRKAKFYAKYICVGEYGPSTRRPHYHCILWTDCPVEKIEGYWRQGSIHFGTLTMQSAMYTLKYIIQPKQRDVFGIEKTRAQFSKGLGLSYLTSAVYDYHTSDYDSPTLFSVIDGNKVALPRYYKQKIFTKYQLRKEAAKSKKESVEKYRKRLREVSFLGECGLRPPIGSPWTQRLAYDKKVKDYLQGLRAEGARRIIETTKYGTSL